MNLEQKICNMIMIGFHGKYPTDPGVKLVISYLEQSMIGGVILYKYNIESPQQLKNLTDSLKKANKDVFIAVDQEGGKVERLSKDKGFNGYPTAEFVAREYSLSQAEELYFHMAHELNSYSINLNFAPIVDVNNIKNPCPVIGKLQRSFSDQTSIIIDYAAAFIDAHHKNKIFTSLKHFPGHGFATSDSHHGLTDVTETFDLKELVPFYALIEKDKVDMIMTAHILNKNFDKDYPATLSPITIKSLLRDKGFNGVIISDDLFMGAIIKYYPLHEAIILAVKASCDILLFSSNKAAYSTAPEFNEPENIPHSVKKIIIDALHDNKISKQQIDIAYNRIASLKAKHTW
ncbi:glycoside hydrolase family protein [Rickettsiales bacterium Ac37b]|nr:glycoside hydrolase family protein [Rickettsiales bacterium Ac37b]